MIQSMTGYGKSVLQLPTKKVTIEIKSLNSKNLDLNVRIPSYYKEKELSVRKKLASALVRGKIDFSIFVEMTADETLNNVEKALDEIRPFLMSDGGNIKLLSIEDFIVRVQLQGACTGCSVNQMTLKNGVEATIKKYAPQIEEVINVA